MKCRVLSAYFERERCAYLEDMPVSFCNLKFSLKIMAHRQRIIEENLEFAHTDVYTELPIGYYGGIGLYFIMVLSDGVPFTDDWSSF